MGPPPAPAGIEGAGAIVHDATESEDGVDDLVDDLEQLARLAVMCTLVMVQLGCLVPLNETCNPQTILILPLCYCPMCPIQWDRVQFMNWIMHRGCTHPWVFLF